MAERKVKPPVDARDAGVPYVEPPRRELAATPARGTFRDLIESDEDA